MRASLNTTRVSTHVDSDRYMNDLTTNNCVFTSRFVFFDLKDFSIHKDLVPSSSQPIIYKATTSSIVLAV